MIIKLFVHVVRVIDEKYLIEILIFASSSYSVWKDIANLHNDFYGDFPVLFIPWRRFLWVTNFMEISLRPTAKHKFIPDAFK